MENNNNAMACEEITFNGSTREYLLLSLTNLILILLTAGLYYPWAKIRSQKYLYEHTCANSQALRFSASVKPLLASYIGIVFLLGLWALAVSSLHEDVLRLDASTEVHDHSEHSGHKNDDFEWHPDISEGEKDYLLNGHKHADPEQVLKAQFEDKSAQLVSLGVMIVLLALLLPALDYARMRYFTNSSGFAENTLSLHGSLLALYWLYLKFLLITLLVAIVVIVLMMLAAAAASSIVTPELASNSLHNSGGIFWLMILMVVAAGVWLIAKLNIWRLQWRLKGLQLGAIKFSGHYKTGALFRLYFMHTVCIFLTLGLAIPWAIINSYRYQLQGLDCRWDSAAAPASSAN